MPGASIVEFVDVRKTYQMGAVTVEAYLLDFDGDLYDRRVRLEILDRLRDEQRFESIDALIAQITADVARVRAVTREA